MILARILFSGFAKWSKPKAKPKTSKILRSFAMGDQKAAKLSKTEQEKEDKEKAIEEEKIQKQTKRKVQIVKSHDASLEQFKSKRQLLKLQYYQEFYLKGSSKLPPPDKATEEFPRNEVQSVDFEYDPILQNTFNDDKNKYVDAQPKYGNYTKQINHKFQPDIHNFSGDPSMRRVGTLGVKLGMTTLWDRWGDMVPVTIVLLDRVQVVQIKPPNQGNSFYQVQMGLGSKKLKKVNKPLLGHYLKARVPPKQHLQEFKVSKECLLPVGYMISARHFTPGMYVDVKGKTVGHGFQGTIKKQNFSRQPATHGNSLTTRVLGSTGQRQDPGRVFKNKKMYGRMGGYNRTQAGMTVFRIDVDKNILYIKGTLPGKAGTVLKIYDSVLQNKAQKNMQLTHFPTFVQVAGKRYAQQFSMYCGERDPSEIELHDNSYILDDDEDADKEDTPTKDADLEEG